MIDVSVVIPFYNESDGMINLINGINKYQESCKFKFEIIFVNDGSTDDSLNQLRNTAKILFPSIVITFSKNFGSHAAIRAGFLHAKGRFICYLPADLQISLEAIEKLYETATRGYDVVIGIRKTIEIGRIEKLFSRIYASIMRKYALNDFPYEGIETLLISEKVKNQFNLNIESNSSFALQILSMGFNKKFVDIEKTSRKSGKSKWTFSKKIKLLVDSFVAFSYAPIRFVTYMGFLFFIVGVLWTVYIVGRKFISNDLVSGWPMLTSILLLGFGITNISLGIIAEYLWRALDASRNRPAFIIDDILELKHT